MPKSEQKAQPQKQPSRIERLLNGDAYTITVSRNGEAVAQFPAQPVEFGSGSVGYRTLGKVPSPDGGKFQLNSQLVLVGSKNME